MGLYIIVFIVQSLQLQFNPYTIHTLKKIYTKNHVASTTIDFTVIGLICINLPLETILSSFKPISSYTKDNKPRKNYISINELDGKNRDLVYQLTIVRNAVYFQDEIVNIRLPKFSIQSTPRLQDALRSLGVTSLFRRGVTAPDTQLMVDDILYKCVSLGSNCT